MPCTLSLPCGLAQSSVGAPCFPNKPQSFGLQSFLLIRGNLVKVLNCEMHHKHWYFYICLAHCLLIPLDALTSFAAH